VSIPWDSRQSAEVLVFPSLSPYLKLPPAHILFSSDQKDVQLPDSRMGVTLEAADAIF